MPPQHSTHLCSNDEPLGLLAGWGRFPFAVAKAMRKQGRRIAGIGITDHADPRLAELCDEFDWIGIGGIGRAIRLFRRWGVSQATMAGKVHKVLFYQPAWWLRHRPDWKAIKVFSPQLVLSTADRKDDTLLLAVVGAFAKEGINFVPATDFAPQLLVREGHVAGKRLTGRQQRDVLFGWEIAKKMGELDIGQSVCVKNQTVLAVEAIEGTDECVLRAGQLCRSGGFSLVKVAKPEQDMRFDVPTVGVMTLESLAKSGGKVLAVEAGRTILLDGDDFQKTASRLKLAVVAVEVETFAKAAA